MNSDVKLAAPAPDDGYPPGYSRQPQEGARGDAPDVAALRGFVGRYVTAMLACAGMRRASDRDAKRQLDLKADAAGAVLDSALEARPAAVGAEDYRAAWECLDMVREKLEGLGTDMKATPPMFYPEAIQATLYRWCKRALAGELEERDGKIAARLASPAGGTPK